VSVHFFRRVQENAVKFLRPILLSVLCNSSDTVYPESREIWRTIVESGNRDLMREIFSLRRVTSAASCVIFNAMAVLQLKKFGDIESVLLLLSSTKRMVAFSLDISPNIEALRGSVKIIESNPDVSNVVLFILAEILQTSSIMHIPRLSQFLDHLIVTLRFGNVVILHMVLDGLIQALAYPSFMGKEMQAVEKLVNFIRSRKYLEQQQAIVKTANRVEATLLMDQSLSNAHEICAILESSPSFQLTTIAHENEKSFWLRNQLVLRGFFHATSLGNVEQSQWHITLTTLVQLSKAHDELKSSLVMPLLFRLAESFDPRIKVAILQNLIELGASNEIFTTVKALSGGMLRSMSIDLFLRLWKVEPRTYPFLHKTLVEKSELDREDTCLDIARAAAIKEVCDLKPHHGSDLVSLIAQILTESMESRDAEIPASLAIDSISLLCQNHIISVTSTWKAIAISTRYEKRPRVIKSLCKFFSIVPRFRRNNQEFENFNKEIVSRLFHMIEWSDSFGKQCALNALSNWNYETFTLDLIPENYRENIALPQAAPGMEVSILDLEVPGECYVQLLTKVDAAAREAAGELLSHFIRQEISEYRSGNYIVKEGQSEPTNYKSFPKQSIVKALVHFLVQQATTTQEQKLVDELITAEALRVLAQNYSRPLPPLNWSFLHELIRKGSTPQIKQKCIAVAAKQAVISGTAKRLIDNFLININEKCEEDDVEIALGLLADLCNGASSDILKLFYERVCTCSHAIQDENIINLLRREKDVTNRENLAMIVSAFINRNASETSTSIIEAIPSNILNVIHLTSAKKIRYRCEILKENCLVENPVSWLNELIVEQLFQNECREQLTCSIEKLFIATKSFPKKKWLSEFIILTQNKMVEKSITDDDLQFLLDIFTSVVIIMSGYFVVGKSDVSRYHRQLFAQAVELLSHHKSNDDIIGSIFEFIFFVCTYDTTSADMKTSFRNAIVISKDHAYFKKFSVWQKTLQIIISDL
jgi:hypothetical protein